MDIEANRPDPDDPYEVIWTKAAAPAWMTEMAQRARVVEGRCINIEGFEELIDALPPMNTMPPKDRQWPFGPFHYNGELESWE